MSSFASKTYLFFVLLFVFASFLLSAGATENRELILSRKLAKLKLSRGMLVPRYRRQFYAVLAVTTSESNELKICGGALVSRWWVLTTADCTVGYQTLDIILGIRDLNATREPERSFFVPSGVYYHPCYNRFRPGVRGIGADDLVMIRLNRPSSRAPICLPTSSHSDWRGLTYGRALYNCTVMGFGPNPLSAGNSRLKEVRLGPVSRSACRRHGPLPSDKLCSRDLVGRAACAGDDGAPLICQSTVPQCDYYYLAGITYADATLCENNENKSGVFTAVFNNVEWIRTYTSGAYNRTTNASSNIFACSDDIARPRIVDQLLEIPSSSASG